LPGSVSVHSARAPPRSTGAGTGDGPPPPSISRKRSWTGSAPRRGLRSLARRCRGARTPRMRMLPDLTPLMRQYRQVKQRYPDAILFFRVGDFYEMFYEDAIEGSRLLEIALTSRDKHKADQVPLCGVPYHAATSYIAKLLRVGRAVAVCDQVEDPQTAKGLVRREAVRVDTPGTLIAPDLPARGEPSHLAAIAPGSSGAGVAWLDLSTAE